MGALQGLKILDFSTLLPGPYSTMVMADMGAQVLRVCFKDMHGPLDDAPPFVKGTAFSASAAWLGRNKRSMFLNLKHPGAYEVVCRLLGEYDIIFEQFRPGVMQRLGFGYDKLKTVNPRLIYCSLTGYGQSGAMRANAGHDINYLARSGLMQWSGRASDGPAMSVQISDFFGSMNVVTGILAAVIHRFSTGEGQYIDISMRDSVIPLNSSYGAALLAGNPPPRREGERLNGGGLYDFYETKDGQYISVGALEQKFFENFCDALGVPELASLTSSPSDGGAAKEVVRERFLTKTLEQWTQIFKDADACVEPVMQMQDAFDTDDRDMIVDVPLPVGGGTVRQMGNPIKMSVSPPEYLHAAHRAGEDTRDVMESLGYGEDDFAAFERDGLFD